MENLRRAAIALGRMAYVLAWLLVISAAVLIGLERGPWLRVAVNERLSRELGSLAPHFSVDDVHVRWLDGTLELEGVRFVRPDGGLFLNRVSIALDPFGGPDGGPSVRDVEITGGRLGLYQEVLEDLSELIGSSPGLTSVPADRGVSGLPRLVVRDVHVDFHTPRFGVVPVGEVDLYFESDEARGSALHGRLRPALAVPGAEAPVHFSGTLGEDLLTLRAASRGVRLGTRHLGRAPFLELLPLIDPTAEVKLNGELTLPLDGKTPPRARARLAIEDASFTPRAELPPVAGLALELDTAFEPEPGQGLYTTRAWSMAGSLDGNWLGTPISGWLRAGRSAPPGSALEGWVQLPTFPTGQETLAALLRILGNEEARDAARVYWTMLQPEGTADVLLALSVPRPFDPPETWRWLADVQLDGGVTLAWHGLPRWRNKRFDPEDERLGVPVPISDMRGRVVYARDPARPRADLAGLVDLNGMPRGVSAESPESRGRVDGVLAVPLVRGWGLDLELDIRMPPVVVDELLLADLDAMPATRSIARDYSPLGGTAEVRLGIQANERTRGVLLAIDIAFREATMAWKEIPVRVRDMNGNLAVRWTRERKGVSLLNGRPSRPLGVHFDGGGSFGVGERQSVAVEVNWREEASGDPPRSAINSRGESYLLNPSALAVRVDFDDLSLSGDDFQVLRASQPELDRVTREFAPKGWVDLSYETAQETPNGAGRWEAEVHPGRVELLPAVFPVPTRDVRGRVIVRGRFPDLDDEAPGPPPTAVRLDLEGIWQAGGVDVTGSGEKLPGRDGEATLFAAGVDPSNRSFLGSIGDVVAGGRGGLDLSALALGGTLDFKGVLPLVDAPSATDDAAGPVARGPETPEDRPRAEPPTRFRVYLRDNELAVDTLHLTGMRGVLDQEAGALQSARIDAFLASTPVRLEGARFLDAEALGRHPETARQLEDMGVTAGAESYVFLAELAALTPMPLDEEHLSLFFEGDVLRSVLDRLGLRGRLRFDELAIAVTGDGRGRGQVGLRGPVAVEDAYVLLGLPIEVERGDLDLHSLVLEAGRLRGWVDLAGVDGGIADRSIRDTSMTLTYVDGRLSIDDLEARFDFGGADDGMLTSLGGGGGRALAIDLADPYRFDLALEARRARLSGLLEGLFDADIREPGLLDGRLVLAGSPDHLTKIQGGGRMELYDARLWSVPVARELFTSLGLDDTATFQEMSMGFEVEGGVVTMHNMRAASPLLKLVGDGTVDMDGRLDVDLEVRYSLVDKLGPFTQLLYAFQDLFVHGIAVRGDMNRPVILLRNALREFFTGFDEDRRYLPVPLFQPFPERF